MRLLIRPPFPVQYVVAMCGAIFDGIGAVSMEVERAEHEATCELCLALRPPRRY